MNWLNRISDDLSVLPDFVAEYETKLLEAKKAVSIHGRIETQMSSLPANTETVFNDLQLIESVLKQLEIRLRKIRSEVFKKFLEGYNRALSSRDAEKYVDGNDDVINMELLINEIAYLRNRYLGVMRGLESKNFMLGHISKLRVVGLEDASI